MKIHFSRLTLKLKDCKVFTVGVIWKSLFSVLKSCLIHNSFSICRIRERWGRGIFLVFNGTCSFVILEYIMLKKY